MAPLDAPAAVLPPQDADQRTPAWLRNAVASAADRRPAIALVIDDMGINRRAAAAINRLRGPLTLAFLPYATKLDEQTRAARAAGHELLVHVPMEPRGQEWPGPNALTSQLEPAELITRLRTHLSSFRGFVGINNHMGSLLTTDPMRMAILMAELRRLGLLFLDSRTTPQSIAAREAERIGVPHAQRDVFIDNDLDRGSVLRELGACGAHRPPPRSCGGDRPPARRDDRGPQDLAADAGGARHRARADQHDRRPPVVRQRHSPGRRRLRPSRGGRDCGGVRQETGIRVTARSLRT